MKDGRLNRRGSCAVMWVYPHYKCNNIFPTNPFGNMQNSRSERSVGTERWRRAEEASETGVFP